MGRLNKREREREREYRVNRELCVFECIDNWVGDGLGVDKRRDEWWDKEK